MRQSLWSVYGVPNSKVNGAQHGAHLGPVGPKWAPCWPHEACYQEYYESHFMRVKHIRIYHRKVHVAHMGPTWFLSAPGRPHVGPMKPAIWVVIMVSVVLILGTNCVSRHNADWGTYLLSAFSWPLMTCVDVNCVDGISFKISDKIFWYPVALTECLQCTYLLFNGEYIQ